MLTCKDNYLYVKVKVIQYNIGNTNTVNQLRIYYLFISALAINRYLMLQFRYVSTLYYLELYACDWVAKY